ncbi:hypothetical protein EDB19DRAFT_1834137 [Suillus lakei]|nr:hypothetical protein EDB19DRAFT_1834137 [Suillus lakei]
MQSVAPAPNYAAAPVAPTANDTLGSVVNVDYRAGSPQKVTPVRKGAINTLPEEIILHIFKLGSSSREGIDFAVLVSHVCQTWRNVAFSCSSLWADITITLGNMHHIDRGLAITNRSLLRAKEFVLRSRVLPLSVQLELPITVPCNFMLNASPIMDWLCLVLPRVRYLSVHCDTHHVAWFILSRLQTASMETLETFEMNSGTTILSFFPSTLPPQHLPFDFTTGQNTEQAVDNVHSKLTHVKVSGFPVSWSQWSLTRLTSLSINFMTFHDRPSMAMLKHVLTMNRETLERFEIQGAIQQSGPLPHNADELPTNLPKLKDLTIGYLSQWEATIFLLHFEAPALKHLKLCDISRSLLLQHWPQDFQDGFDLNNPIFHNIYALQPFHDFSSTMLLEILAYGLTSILEQVETLTLEHVCIPPDFSDLFLQDNDPMKHLFGSRVVLAYRMLQTCSQLRRLTLINPEQCLLDALNIYPSNASVDDTNTDVTENNGPAPVLTHLYLASPHPDRLRYFLTEREENIAKKKGPHILDHLELATSREAVKHLVEAIESDHIKLSDLAKSNLVTEWQGSFTTI